jgi:hypothetical protein
MGKYLAAIALVFLLLFGLALVQRLSRREARRHPEFGPYREGGAGCGGCAAPGDSCGADERE